MTFEGDPKAIPVKGIMRAGADSVIEDGAMNEVIGLEYKEGSYVPYTGDTNANLVIPEDVERVYVHKTSVQTNVIIKFEDHLSWMSLENFEDGNGRDESRWDDLYVGVVKDVEFIGNVVCISTNNDYMTYIFSNNSYELYSNYTVDNNISIRMVDGVGGQDDDCYGVWYSDRENKDTEVDFIKATGYAHEKGGLVGHVFAAVACRMSTGEIVNLSNVVLLKTSRSSQYVKLTDGTNVLLNGDVPYAIIPSAPISTESYGYATKTRSDSECSILSSNGTTQSVATSPALYKFISQGIDAEGKDIVHYGCVYSCGKLQIKISPDAFKGSKTIASICVFISDDISRFGNYKDSIEIGPYKYGSDQGRKYTSFYPIEKKANIDEGDVRNINALYLVGEYGIENITRNEWFDINLEGKLGDNLFVQPSMNTADITTYKYQGANIDSYNYRIHLSKFYQNIYYPYGALFYERSTGTSGLTSGEQLTEASMEVDVYLRNSMQEEYKIVLYSNNANDIISIGNFLSFPSLDAYKIIVRKRIVYNNYDVKNFKGEYTLNKLPSLGIAYSLDTINLQLEDTTYNLPVEQSTSLSFVNTNKLVVSDTYTPYYFPKQNAYTIGNGSIVGLASLSITLSQDTFGQYPLLVFCTDGIYSMGVDTTGAGVYSNIAPFSREVCVNPNSICEIDGAVLFASSKGLMMATAQGVDAFLPMMNGVPKHRPQTDKNAYGLGLVTYHDCISNEQITRLWSCIDDMDFRNYIADQSTYITYASEKNKIVVYNGNEPYIYWIDIPTRNVTKLPVSIKLDNNDYPTELYVKSNNTMMEFKQLSANVDTPTMFQTRPIKLEGGFKSGLRVVVRGYFKSDIEDKWAALVVLGSYDGVNWQPIGIQQKPVNKGFHDIGCNTDRVSHKYMMIIFSASLNRDSHIDGIELTKYNKYNNKLK